VDASVIVIDWHQPELTRRSLDALLAQRTSWSYELVVVVNEADDQTVAGYRADYPDAIVVPEPTNSGFAGGVTRGIAAAHGRVIVLVNNDAVADNGFLERGLSMLDGLPTEVAALAATTVLEGGFRPASGAAGPDDLVSPRGGRWRRVSGELSLPGEALLNGTGVVLDRTGNGRDRDWLAPLNGPREDAVLFGFSGGAAFLRKEALEEIGSFDPALFMYYEDVDVSWRLRLAGYDIRYAPDAVVVHRHAASSASDSPLVRYQSMRNRLAVVLRNGSPAMIRRVLFRTVVRMLLDVVRPSSAQLTRADWRRLVLEAPAIARHARHLRRGDGWGPAVRREIEMRYIDESRIAAEARREVPVVGEG
jgi:GT2 family glycosyltransferase